MVQISAANSGQSPVPQFQLFEEREVQLHIEEDESVGFSDHLSILEQMEAGEAIDPLGELELDTQIMKQISS